MKGMLLFAAAFVIVTAMPARAFGPDYCASNFSLSRSDSDGQGFKTLGIYFTDGSASFSRMNKQQWTSCRCLRAEASCTCCEYDVAKVCAEVVRINTTTQNRLHLGVCERI